jgi:CRAL/TRIO domain
MLENFLVIHQAYPQWFRDFGLTSDLRMKELFDSGYIIPMKDRDKNGCRVVMVQGRKLDPKKFTSNDVYRIISWVFANLKEEHETQIAGAIFILDCKDVTIEQISLFSFSEVKNFISCVQNAIPCRFKQALFINFPSFGVTLADLIKSFLSSKLKERTVFSSGSDTLFEFVDKKILPEEYGGETSIQIMIDRFKDETRSREEKIKEYEKFHIDVEMVKKFKSIDSFKKLDVD